MRRSRQQLERVLEQLEQEAQERRQQQEEVDAEDRRWLETLERFGEALPPDLHARVTQALEADRHCSVWAWIENVYVGRSRLPDGLSPEVMRRLVQILLEEGEQCLAWVGVCLRCGLQYPLPRWRYESRSHASDSHATPAAERRYEESFFEHNGCPGCGASSKKGDMTWAHLIGEGYWFTRRRENPGGTADDVYGPSPPPRSAGEPSDDRHGEEEP